MRKTKRKSNQDDRKILKLIVRPKQRCRCDSAPRAAFEWTNQFPPVGEFRCECDVCTAPYEMEVEYVREEGG